MAVYQAGPSPLAGPIAGPKSGRRPDHVTAPASGVKTGAPLDAPHRPARVGPFVNLLGGLASLALVLGIGAWGYKTVMRDVSGVPVIRATGELRSAPDNPGGRLANNIGLAVNGVAASGLAERPADRLILAPAPVALRDEDRPISQIVPVARPASNAPQAASSAANTRSTSRDLTTRQMAAVTPQARDANTVASPAQDTPSRSGEIRAPRPIDALAASLLAGAKPLSGETVTLGAPDSAAAIALRDAQQQQAALGAATPIAAEPAIQHLVPKNPIIPARSLRPRLRPASLPRPASVMAITKIAGSGSGNAGTIVAPAPIAGSAVTTNVAASLAAASGIEVPIDQVVAGTRLAQLGAYDSPEVARKEWDRFALRFRDYMGDKQRVIQQASSGGRTFYRLRVMGFADLSEARHFCAALVADKVDCIPVVMK